MGRCPFQLQSRTELSRLKPLMAEEGDWNGHACQILKLNSIAHRHMIL